MDKKPKTFSWDEFKAKVAVENKMSREVSQKSDKEKIDHFLENYEKKAEAIGSIYWMDWKYLNVINNKYKNWLEKRLETVSLKNDSAFKPHPAIRYISTNGGNHFWFLGTSRKDTVKWNLRVTKEKTDPFVVEECSAEYAYCYSEIKRRKNEYCSFNDFSKLWTKRLRFFPEKGHGSSFYTVSNKTMFLLVGETDIDNYLGTLSKEKILEMRSILTKSIQTRGCN